MVEYDQEEAFYYWVLSDVCSLIHRYGYTKVLNDIDKALIFLYLEDKPFHEIAETLGISNVNARVKMNRAKEKLKAILNP